ncbi:unnamed protein product, partial [Closterium sp. Naga37s-1]
LQECAVAWNRTFSGWTAGGDCWLAEKIECDAKGMVTSLLFSGLNMNGTVPTSIASLTALTSFDLSMNNLSGSIPSFISRLSQLFYLNIEDNSFFGPIPSTIGALKNLKTLMLANTGISGTIPSTISGLSALTVFRLSNTHLSGTIPSTIGRLASLEYMTIANTNLSGSLPASLGALPKLNKVFTNAGVTCGRAGSSCEIQQNASSFFCRVLCFEFCASCIPLNATRVFSSRSCCLKFPVSLVAQATGGWSDDSRVQGQGWSSSSSGGQRYKAVSLVNERQVWFVVRRSNEELSANFQKEVAKLCVADHAVEQAEEQVLVFEWVPGGNLHSRLVADLSTITNSPPLPPLSDPSGRTGARSAGAAAPR